MSADKLPCLVITKVSPEIIEAWKNPKKLKWTSLNQFKRCAQYYVETTITNVLPSIKNKEHFTSLEQADSKSNDMFKNRPKTLFEEAQEFLGNVELTKRTRAQQKQIYKVESTPSTSSAINQVSSAANKKRIISLEHRGNRVGRNDRMNSLITPNKSKPNDKECNDLTVPSSINRDIVDKSVEPMQTLSDNSKSQAIQSTSKKCTTSVKTEKVQLISSNNSKISQGALDMPQLSDFMSCQNNMLTNVTSKPKLVLMINRLSGHYQAYSDVDDSELVSIKPESSRNVTQTTPHITSSFTNNVATGVGIGYKNIQIIKPSNMKLTVKAGGNKCKIPVTNKAEKGVDANGKVTKTLKVNLRKLPGRDIATFSDTAHSDNQLVKAHIKKHSRESSDLEENKPLVTKAAEIGVKVPKVHKIKPRKQPTRDLYNFSDATPVTKKARKSVNASVKLPKPHKINQRKQAALSTLSDTAYSDEQLAKPQIKKPRLGSSDREESKPSVTKAAEIGVKVHKIKPRSARDLFTFSDTTGSHSQRVKDQMKESNRETTDREESKPSVTKTAGKGVKASLKLPKAQKTTPRRQPTRDLFTFSGPAGSDSQLAKSQIIEFNSESSHREECKPLVTKKAGSGVDPSVKVTKARIIKPRQKTALEILLTCSDTSDSDSNFLNKQIKKPRRESSDFGRSGINFVDLFGKDSDSNNEVIQNSDDKVTNMNDKVVNKIMHESDNMNNKCASLSDESTSSSDESISNVTNKSTKKPIDKKIIINESKNAETDDSDVISLCADEDFNEDFDFEETTTIAPNKVASSRYIASKKINSSTSVESTTAWSASLDDCIMTIRKDSVSDTPNCVKNSDATRNFNNNTNTIVKNMPPKPLIENKQLTFMLKKVFQGICVEFINDNCKKTVCAQSHEFPSADILQQNMKNVNVTTIENAYKFMKNYQKMFLMYFPLFCDIFSFFKLPNQLKSMFKDCERHTRTIDYYRHVVAGLTNLGISKYKSIRMCIESATDSSYARETITSMIAETGPDVVRFVDYLTHCGTLPIPMYNKIMEHCVNYQNPDLQYYLLNSYKNVNQHNTASSQVNVTTLIKLIELIKRSQEFNNEQNEGLLDVLKTVCSI